MSATITAGPTGEKLKRIVKAQNPRLAEIMGEKELDAWLDTWESMPATAGNNPGKLHKFLSKKYQGKKLGKILMQKLIPPNMR